MSAPAAPAPATTAIGVGFDTSRYGHHVTFLQVDLQPACPAFEFPESRAGYDLLLDKFHSLHQRFTDVHFHIRLDVAGQYAANLETFLRGLPFATTITLGDPVRNQNYRKAIFPKRKADPVDSLAAARFALLEKPAATACVPTGHVQLREIVQRLEGQTRHTTRLTNQLHNLLARVFPELALEAPDLQARWILLLLAKYPTPAQLARARLATLTALPFVTQDKAAALQSRAHSSVASVSGDVAGTLVRQLVEQLRRGIAQADALKKLMIAAYQQLPANHLDSIPGIGLATAAILTAKMVHCTRFASPSHLVGYFGIFPEEDSSGIGKDGRPKPGRATAMSKKGNDLVRKYLWNAAKSAIVHNPAVRAQYARLRARGVRGDVALGHAMQKLLHLAFAIWTTGRPFDPEHYPWQTPATDTNESSHEPSNAKTAGHNQGLRPDAKVVTAVAATVPPSVPLNQANPGMPAMPTPSATPAATGPIDYAALRAQVRMEQVLAQLGCLTSLKGSGLQRRGPCPLHARHDPRNRSFSVHLGKNVFQCFHPPCAAHGNVLDLWAAAHHLPLHEAARHLAETFHLDLTAPPRTEKRNP